MRVLFISILVRLISCNTQHKNSNALQKPSTDSIKKTNIAIEVKDSIKPQEPELSEAQMDSDLLYVIYAQDSARKLTRKEIEKYIKISLNECGRSMNDFMENNNELIYHLLSLRTKDFLNSLSEVDSTMLDSCFIREISGPLHPEPYDKIIYKVRKTNCDKNLKEKIILALLQGKEYDKRQFGEHPPADSA